MKYEGVFKGITLTVHSSLEAVGLTAAISSKLAEKGISANVIAAYYHDHIFVQTEKAEMAMEALNEFGS
nr:ACT domain-containing protein [Desulforhopalus vacuolatus]